MVEADDGTCSFHFLESIGEFFGGLGQQGVEAKDARA